MEMELVKTGDLLPDEQVSPDYRYHKISEAWSKDSNTIMDNFGVVGTTVIADYLNLGNFEHYNGMLKILEVARV
jgi:hypothetical protein